MRGRPIGVMGGSAKNAVYLDGRGIIHNDYSGDQTYEDVKRVESMTHELAALMAARGEPVRILADLTRLGGSSAGSRRAAKEAIESVPQARIAVFGGNPFTKHLANFILLATRRHETVRYLASSSEAAAWLLDEEDLS